MSKHVIDAGDDTFDQEVLKSTVPVLVDFGHLGADHAR